MTRDETKTILMAIMAAYPNWHPVNLELVINTWHMMLEEYDYNAISAGLKAYILTDKNGFAPSIGQVVDQLSKANEEQTALEAWSCVYGRMQSSIYYATENFNSLPEVIKKAIGSADVLRQWALTDVDSLPVIQANFVKAYNIELARQRESAKIPPKIKALLSSTANKLLTDEGRT